MIPAEIINKVRIIEIKTRNIVNDLFGGVYHSAFKGMGMEFAEVREYYPGDDPSIARILLRRLGEHRPHGLPDRGHPRAVPRGREYLGCSAARDP